MFNLQGGELMIILLLALVVLGPEKLPEAMRKLGKMYGEFKRMSSGFQEEFRSAVDEPMREFRKAVDEPMNEIRGTANSLRDSADFRRLETGARTEKPKSGDMAAITESATLLNPADPEAVPVAATPNFEPADGSDPDPGPVDDEAPAHDVGKTIGTAHSPHVASSVTSNPEERAADNGETVANGEVDVDQRSSDREKPGASE